MVYNIFVNTRHKDFCFHMNVVRYKETECFSNIQVDIYNVTNDVKQDIEIKDSTIHINILLVAYILHFPRCTAGIVAEV